MTMERDTLPTPLYVGVAPVSYRLDGSGAVVITGGWNPTMVRALTNPIDYLFIVAT
jgi:hypothetical protein